MIKNKESNIIQTIKDKINEIILNVRKVDDNGKPHFEEIQMKTYTTANKEFVDIMRVGGGSPTQYTDSTNTYSTEFQQMYYMLVEIIVKETIAILIRDTEVSSLARLNKLEKDFDALVNALSTIPQNAGAINVYKQENPKSDRDTLRDEEVRQRTDLK